MEEKIIKRVNEYRIITGKDPEKIFLSKNDCETLLKEIGSNNISQKTKYKLEEFYSIPVFINELLSDGEFFLSPITSSKKSDCFPLFYCQHKNDEINCKFHEKKGSKSYNYVNSCVFLGVDGETCINTNCNKEACQYFINEYAKNI